MALATVYENQIYKSGVEARDPGLIYKFESHQYIDGIESEENGQK